MKLRQQLTIYICEDNKAHSKKLFEVCSLLAEEYPLEVEVFQSANQLLQQLDKLQQENEVFSNVIVV